MRPGDVPPRALDDDGPSARVRLELACLDAKLDAGGAAPASRASARDAGGGTTLLVAAAEADLRRYVRECLRERPDLRVVDAGGGETAAALAARLRPQLLVVDAAERAVLAAGLAAMPHLGAVVLVDEVPRGASDAGPRVRLLARPFSADALLSAIARLVG